MDIRQIRVFTAILNAGSIVGAANQERTAPSVIAHHLVNLEHQLGQKLFDRSSRGAVPTLAGNQFAPHASAILRAIDSAESDMRDVTNTLTGRVVVGFAFSAVVGIGVKLITEIAEHQPGLQLEIAESVSGATVEHFLAADVDLALAYNPPKDARLRLTPILEERMICLGKPGLVGPSDQPMTMEHFLTMKYVLSRVGLRGRPTANDTDIQKLLERNASLVSQNVTAAILLVNSGYGVMLGTRANIEYGTFDADIVGREFTEQEITRSLYLCERRDAPTSRSIAYTKNLIIELIATEIDTGCWECRPLMA